MKRLIGLRKRDKNKITKVKEEPPKISDCIANVDNKADLVDKKIEKCQEDLKKLNEQIKNSRTQSTKNMFKQKALHVLKQLKGYESQVDGLRQQSFNMEQATNSISMAQETQILMTTMKTGIAGMNKVYKDINITDIEELQDEISDALKTSEEIQETFGRSYNMPDIDDDELQAEFDALGDELAFDSTIIDTALLDKSTGTDGTSDNNQPTTRTEIIPAESTKTVVGGITVDEFGLPILAENGSSSLFDKNKK